MDERRIKEITLCTYAVRGFETGIAEIIRPGGSSGL
jgi:hypothetical protein